MDRVFHQIEFSTFLGSETHEIQYVRPILDVESESEEKMTTFFWGKKVSRDMTFEIWEFRDFLFFIKTGITHEPTQFFVYVLWDYSSY